MLYSLLAYMIGVVVERLVSPEVGKVFVIASAIVFVFAWLVGLIVGVK